MANGHGGRRVGSGRPKGTHSGALLKSRLSTEQLAMTDDAVRLAVGSGTAFASDAYVLVASVYKNPKLPLAHRVQAAQIAMAYERPRPTRVLVKRSVACEANLIDEIMQSMGGAGSGSSTGYCESLEAKDVEADGPVDDADLT